MIATDITAPTMIAWTEPSPSSPAPAARRCAASGLDRSVRPGRVVGHAVDANLQCLKHQTHLHRNLLHKTSDIPTVIGDNVALSTLTTSFRITSASPTLVAGSALATAVDAMATAKKEKTPQRIKPSPSLVESSLPNV
jgi:hypothetical protein